MTGESVVIIPLWAEVVISVFAISGGLLALLGASGLLRLRTFFSRIHAPALVTSGGVWCLMLATMCYFTVESGVLAINVLLLGLLIAITAPVTTILLMRAALFRARRKGQNVPRSVNTLQLVTPKSAPDIEREEEQRLEEGRRNKKAKEDAEEAAALAELTQAEARLGSSRPDTDIPADTSGEVAPGPDAGNHNKPSA